MNWVPFVIVKDQFFSLGVSQHCINKLVKIWAQLVVEVAREQWQENTLVTQVVCFQMLDFETSSAEVSN